MNGVLPAHKLPRVDRRVVILIGVLALLALAYAWLT